MQQAKSEKSQGICANIRVKGRRGINARTHYTHIEDIAACAPWPRIIAVPWRCAFFAEQTLFRPLKMDYEFLPYVERSGVQMGNATRGRPLVPTVFPAVPKFLCDRNPPGQRVAQLQG